jgi:predicted metalloprotease with PDZ domain
MLGTDMVFATATNALPDRTFARIRTPSGLELHSPWPVAKNLQREGETWYEVPARVTREGGSDYLPLGKWIGPSLTAGDVQFSMLFPPEAAHFEQRLGRSLQGIMKYGLRLFASPSQRNLIFAFRLGQPGSGANVGTVKDNSVYIVFDPKRAEVQPDALAHIIAHEFIHLWGDRARITRVPEMRWLYEGFTDYYASQVCSRLELMQREGFTKQFVEQIEKSLQSPMRGRWSISEAGAKGLQGDNDATELAYSGGWVLAAWLDAAIREESLARGKSPGFAPLEGDVAKPGTLDELLREFYNDSQWSDEHLPTPEAFLERLAKYLPPAQIAKFGRFTTEAWAFDPVKEFPLVGIPIGSRRVPAERLGVILGQGNLIVQQLAPGEAGEIFGLKARDELLRVNGQSVTSTAELRSAWLQSGDGETEIVVRREGQEQTLRGKKPTTERLEVDPALLLR